MKLSAGGNSQIVPNFELIVTGLKMPKIAGEMRRFADNANAKFTIPGNKKEWCRFIAFTPCRWRRLLFFAYHTARQTAQTGA